MVLSLSLLLGNLFCNGFIEATIQRQDVDQRQISTIFWINVGLNLILTLLFVASAPFIASFYGEPQLKPLVVMLSVPILLGALSNQHYALLRRNMEFFKISAAESGATFIGFAIAI